MTKQIINVPDLGGADEVEVIEVCVAVGDVIKKEDSLLVLESDKASMEVPSPYAGKVISLLVKEGDKLKQGAAILEVEVEQGSETVKSEPVPEKPTAPSKPEAATKQAVPVAAVQSVNEIIAVPDIGTTDAVQVIEICVKVGDVVADGDSLIVLESDKASMEVPSPKKGKVLAIKIKEGDSVKQGDAILELQVEGTAAALEASPSAAMPSAKAAAPQLTEPKQVTEQYKTITGMTENRPTGEVYAGPAVRKMAREIGLDLVLVPGSGPRGRIQKEDVKAFIKDALKNRSTAGNAVSGAGIPAIPEIDFSQFGEIRVEALTKLHKLTAANMHRSWLNVPHVTQFDEVDITEMEEFRNGMKTEAEKAGVKLTPLAFILKACAAALKANEKFNASLHADGVNMVYKSYVHIGIAVDTPAGLMVPVIRDVDKKSLLELAAESNELAQKAKERKLKPSEMQGGCFTISSLGSMGGTGFTPIVNAPEVGILGVSKLDIKPRWNGKEFEPRKMLPLCLSYDHRAVNGADAGKFMVFLNNAMSDIRRLSL